MSLINEALKRAKSFHARPVDPPQPEAGLQPVTQGTPVPRVPAWIVPVGALALLLLSFWFFALWWKGSHALAQAPPRAHTNTFVAAMRKALALDPEDEGNLAELGAILILKGDRAEAETQFDKSFKMKPDEFWNTINAAGSYVGVRPQ